MQSDPDDQFRIHPALTSFADECCATLARLVVYVGVLALFAIAGVHFCHRFQFDAAAGPADRPGFALAARSRAAFAVSSLDPPEKSESYEVFRHPAGAVSSSRPVRPGEILPRFSQAVRRAVFANLRLVVPGDHALGEAGSDPLHV